MLLASAMLVASWRNFTSPKFRPLWWKSLRVSSIHGFCLSGAWVRKTHFSLQPHNRVLAGKIPQSRLELFDRIHRVTVLHEEFEEQRVKGAQWRCWGYEGFAAAGSHYCLQAWRCSWLLWAELWISRHIQPRDELWIAAHSPHSTLPQPTPHPPNKRNLEAMKARQTPLSSCTALSCQRVHWPSALRTTGQGNPGRIP